MRTNIDIDDDLMAAAMEAGGYKTKKEAVEEGLRLLRRRKAYADLLAARGTLFWDDSDASWAKLRNAAVQPVAAEATPTYAVQTGSGRAKARQGDTAPPAKRMRSRSKKA